MDEKKLLELLSRDADKITPPKSLQPDAVEALLKEQNNTSKIVDINSKEVNTKANAADTANIDLSHEETRRRTAKQNRRIRFITRYGSLAAIFVLAATVLWQSDRIQKLELRQEAGMELSARGGRMDAATEAAAPADISNPEAADDSNAVTDIETADSLPAPAGSYQDIYDTFQYAESYQEVYQTLHRLFGSSTLAGMARTLEGNLEFEASEEMAIDTLDLGSGSSMSVSPGYGGASDAAHDFSSTNLQELGVDEGDIVKTDGDFLYVLRKDFAFAIIRANAGKPELVSTTKLDVSGLSDVSLKEMYLDGDRLTIAADGRQTILDQDDNIYRTNTKNMTVLTTWDISDRSHPALLGTLNQEGFYADSRKVGNYVYLFTGYQPQIADTFEDSTLIPRINGELIPAESFYLPELPSTRNYLVISSVDLNAPSKTQDEKVLISGAENFYVSPEHIYITGENYQSADTITEIAKFRYADGLITGVAAGSVKGYLNNSFSLNEYNGNLRVVSTSHDENWTEWNSLYILDASLQPLSSIENLGKGETIRSARFFGDTGYFVTFRQTDPLFSVDLSDPFNPKVLGQLKVSGFSSYLHFYGENCLLGIGYDADENTGITTGLKLSMFDISDPANVTEISRTSIPGVTWCPAIEHYKSIFVDPEKNLIGFFCENRYFVYSFQDEDDSFEPKLIYDFYADGFAQDADYQNLRGLYIDDRFYLAGGSFVIPFDMEHAFSKDSEQILRMPE